MITQNINHFNENNNNIQEAEENLLSIEGIEMRVNRSSQVEGAFGVIKQDFQYERFRRCSLAKVSLEFMLVCLGYNIRKLFVIIMEKLNLIVGKFLKILHRKDLRNQVLKGYQKKLLRLRKNLLIKKLKIIINTQNKKGCKSRN